MRFLKLWRGLGEISAAKVVEALIDDQQTSLVALIRSKLGSKPEIEAALQEVQANLDKPVEAQQAGLRHLEPVLSVRYDG